MKYKVSVTNESFKRAGITKDIDQAICEYIWNGFEADATEVIVSKKGEEFKESTDIVISDNGSGIDYNNLKDTFCNFLTSNKNNNINRIKSQSNKGKGRYSYSALSHMVLWETTFRDDKGYQSYTIKNRITNKEEFEIENLRKADKEDTGTIVTIPINESSVLAKLDFEKMETKLLKEFTWYLYLNRDKEYKLEYLGVDFKYSSYIDEELTRTDTIEIEGEKFVIDIVIWNNKIGNTGKIYYINSEGESKHNVNTSFNKNKIEFYHSVYIKSDYFDNLTIIDDTENMSILGMVENQKSIVKQLKEKTIEMLTKVRDSFLRIRSDKEISRMEKEMIFPAFRQNSFGQVRKKYFKKVIKEIYCLEPKIFYKLRPEQEKSLLGFLNLLVNSDERENILTIIDEVTKLSTKQRDKFAKVLKRSKLEHIIDLMDLLQKRYQIIEELKYIIFECKDFANERDHIQKIIEQHYWLFGERYNLLTADKTLKKSLQKYEELIDADANTPNMTKEELRRRMDVFLYSSRMGENSIEECLVIELKTPTKKLTRTVLQQIEDYAYAVLKEPVFAGSSKSWKFIAICTTIDDEVKKQYNAFKDKGKKCLIREIDNFEIYAKTWDDVFTDFKCRHNFLIDKIQRDFEDTASDDIDFIKDRNKVNEITEEITKMKIR